jgi:metal-dependent HD superfamily phosphatase/phosphodiesterase
MSDHSWVRVQIVLNTVPLRLSRLLSRRGVQPAMASEHLHDAHTTRRW